MTYFFNGNRSGKFDVEDYIEVTSDIVPFEQRPWMKAAEINSQRPSSGGKYGFIRLNHANGDIRAYRGQAAVEIAVETVDLCLSRLVKKSQRNSDCYRGPRKFG